jgi:hypothetical protein
MIAARDGIAYLGREIGEPNSIWVMLDWIVGGVVVRRYNVTHNKLRLTSLLTNHKSSIFNFSYYFHTIG